MLTNYYSKNKQITTYPIFKCYLNKYSMVEPYNNKHKYIEYIKKYTLNLLQDKKNNSDEDDDIDYIHSSNEIPFNENLSNETPFNEKPPNGKLYFILGSAIIGLTSYSFYHFFYKKK